MQYIPKLAKLQSQKPGPPHPVQIIKWCTLKTQLCGQLKFLLYTKYCCQASGQNAQLCKSLWTFIYISIYLYLLSLKPRLTHWCSVRYLEDGDGSNVLPGEASVVG